MTTNPLGRGRFWIIVLVVFLLFPSLSPLYADAPEDVLKEIIGKIKAQNDASPVVEYVDWNKAFTEMPPPQKMAMKINSPQEMKSFYKQVLANPSAMMKKQFEERLGMIPEAQRPMMRQSLARMEEMMKQKEAEMKQKIAGTTYEVGKSEINGANAKVELKQTYEGKTKVEKVEFVKSGDNWLLASVGLVNPQGRVKSNTRPPVVAPSSPIGKEASPIGAKTP